MEMKNVCDSLGIRVIAYSPLGLGMLTGKYTPSNLPPGPRYALSISSQVLIFLTSKSAGIAQATI